MVPNRIYSRKIVVTGCYEISICIPTFCIIFADQQFMHQYSKYKMHFISFIVGSCIVTYLFISSGGYESAIYGGENERAKGIVGNANAFAFLLDCLLLILLWFFQLSKSKIFKGILLCFIPVCLKLLISSGSRSGFLGFAMVLGLWYCLFYFKQTFRNPYWPYL